MAPTAIAEAEEEIDGVANCCTVQFVAQLVL